MQWYTQLICGPNKGTWPTEFSKHIGRLEQGVVNRVKSTNTIFFIHRSAVPAGKRVTYGQIVESIRSNKAKTHRFCITIGKVRLSYEGHTAAKYASLIETKILFNGVV